MGAVARAWGVRARRGGFARAGVFARAGEMLLLAFVLFVLFMRIALRVAVVDCMDELRETESFKTRPGSMSESSPLESYDIFRDCAQLRPGVLAR